MLLAVEGDAAPQAGRVPQRQVAGLPAVFRCRAAAAVEGVQIGVAEKRIAAGEFIPVCRRDPGQRIEQAYIRGGGVRFRSRRRRRLMYSNAMSSLKIAVAQINCTVGDLAGNAARILGAAQRAQKLGADLLVTPELALCGYPPEDLLLRPDFYRACDAELARLSLALPRRRAGTRGGGRPSRTIARAQRYNAASLLRDGRVEATYRKHAPAQLRGLRRGALFRRPAASPAWSNSRACACGINICADVWEARRGRGGAAGRRRTAAGRSTPRPSTCDKQARRYEVLRERIAETGMPVDLRQPGRRPGRTGVRRRFVRARCRRRADASAAGFRRGAGDRRIRRRRPAARRRSAPWIGAEAEVYEALWLGVRDYIGKNGFPGAILGLSGGIDSALTLGVAVDALGRRQGARGDDAVALHRGDEPRRFARHGAAARRALRRDRDRAGDDDLRRDAGAAVRGPARGRHRREPAGAHPRHAADGAVQQDRRASC